MIVGTRVKTHTGHIGRIAMIDADTSMVLVKFEDVNPESSVVGQAVYLNRGDSITYYPTVMDRVLDSIDLAFRSLFKTF
jgi:hypothetical protein